MNYCGSAGKESACDVEDLGSIPRLGRCPGERKGYSLQYSGLENSMDCIVHGIAKSQTQLSDFHSFFSISYWEQIKKYLKAVRILPRPFPITYTLGWHQQEISQKEQVNPVLKSVEALPGHSPTTSIQSSKKGCPWTRDACSVGHKAFLSKAKECEKESLPPP